MKTIKANPDLLDLARDLIAANPMEAYAAGVVILLAVTYKLRHAF